MGWLIEDDHPDAHEHEGFAVALVRDAYSHSFRELHYCPEDRDFTGPVTHMAAGCTCGWRSQRLIAPLGTEWMPFAIMLPSEEYEDALAAVWRTEHRLVVDRANDTYHAERRQSWLRDRLGDVGIVDRAADYVLDRVFPSEGAA